MNDLAVKKFTDGVPVSKEFARMVIDEAVIKDFYGQPLDCCDGKIYEHHTCPQCGAPLTRCVCRQNGQYCAELRRLYERRAQPGGWLKMEYK